jgi:hypothetical protein
LRSAPPASLITGEVRQEKLTSRVTVANRDYHYLSQFEIGGSIKGMSTKMLLLRPVAEKFFVSISSPLFADGSRSLERFFSGLLFHSLGSFFEW